MAKIRSGRRRSFAVTASAILLSLAGCGGRAMSEQEEVEQAFWTAQERVEGAEPREVADPPVTCRPNGRLVYRYIDEIRDVWLCTYEPGVNVNDKPIRPGCYTFDGERVTIVFDEDALRDHSLPCPSP